MRIIQILLFFLVTIVIVSAQSPSADQPRVRFRAISFLGESPKDLYYKSKAGMYELIVTYPESRSPFYNLYESTQSIDLFRKAIDPKTQKEIHTQVGAVDIQGKGHTPLLLFMQDPRSPMGFSARAMRDDADAVPAGSYHFVNLTASSIKMAMNKTMHLIPAGGEVFATLAPDNSNIRTVMVENHDGADNFFYSNVWGREKQITTLVFIYTNPDADNAFSVSRIIDYPSTWKPQAK